MRWSALFLCLFASHLCCAGQIDEQKREAEYYVAAYAQHYNVPVEFVRAVVEQVRMEEMSSFVERGSGPNAAHAGYCRTPECAEPL